MKNMIKIKWYFIFFLPLFIVLLTSFSVLSSQEDYGSWWINNYGVLTKNDHPLVSKAIDIFYKILKAGDKKSNRYPKLVVLRVEDKPWSLCVKDGTVLLTQRAMELCLNNKDKKKGEACLAFVLAHEIAHLANDDFWHLDAYKVVKKFGNGTKIDKAIIDMIIRTSDIKDSLEAAKYLQMKELKADSCAILYVAMAGFDTNAIVKLNGENFLHEWAQIIPGKVNTINIHPAPNKRTNIMIKSLQKVKNNIDFFYWGIRLYQLGRDMDALEFMEGFREQFPSREVYNNLGLIHYQLAIKAMAKCDTHRAYKYKLPEIVDTESRASNIFRRTRDRAESNECIEMEIFREHIEYAIRDFKSANDKDDEYFPSRLNLSSAYILGEYYSDALSIVNQCLERKKENILALNNKAIAMFELGPIIHVDMFEQSVKILKHAKNINESFPDTIYNLGRVLNQRKRGSAEREWNKFLSIETDSIYADLVRKNLGIKTQSNIKLKNNKLETLPLLCSESVPVSIGLFLGKKEMKKLVDFKKIDIELGSITGNSYTKETLRILTIDNSVELIECSIKDKMSMAEMKLKYGEPLRSFEINSGITTYVYEKFAFDSKDKIIIKVVYL